jgi:hypothetical protein
MSQSASHLDAIWHVTNRIQTPSHQSKRLQNHTWPMQCRRSPPMAISHSDNGSSLLSKAFQMTTASHGKLLSGHSTQRSHGPWGWIVIFYGTKWNLNTFSEDCEPNPDTDKSVINCLPIEVSCNSWITIQSVRCDASLWWIPTSGFKNPTETPVRA